MNIEILEFYRSKNFPTVLVRVIGFLSNDRIGVEVYCPYKLKTWYYTNDFCLIYRELSALEKELL